jgi:undecaprenyl-diphosphatase
MTVQAIDDTVRAAVHAKSSPALTAAMVLLTGMAAQWFVLPITVLIGLWLGRRSRRSGWLFVGIVLGGELCCELLKLVVHRPRPDPFFGLTAPSSYSFPSGHAFRSLTFYATLAYFRMRHLQRRGTRPALWAAVILLAIGAGFSRVYLGVHYPSDVLGGYALAVVWLALWRVSVTFTCKKASR